MDNRPEHHEESRNACEFDEQASRPQNSLAAEFLEFLLHNKKWWLTPIIIVLLLMGGLLGLAVTGVAPFIYTLF